MEQDARSPAFNRVWAVIRKLTVVLDVVPGVIVGAVLAFGTALLLITAQVHAMQTTVNGWSITMTCGEASNGILVARRLRPGPLRGQPAGRGGVLDGDGGWRGADAHWSA